MQFSLMLENYRNIKQIEANEIENSKIKLQAKIAIEIIDLLRKLCQFVVNSLKMQSSSHD